MRHTALLTLALSTTGCFAAHDEGPADPAAGDAHALAQARCGDDGPAGAPALGRQDCRGHVTVDGLELVDARGVRPQVDGFYYLSATGADGYGDFRLLVPGVEPGTYSSAQCTSLKLWAGTLFVSGATDAPFEVSIEGNDGDAVWGTFAGTLCSSGAEAGQRVDACAPHEGRFSARLEPDNGPPMREGGCLEATECDGAASLGLPAGTCGTEPVCHDGRCLTQ